jgi:glutathione S-transferase
LEKITLYGYPTSPYVMKVACFLNYKQLPYTYIPVNPVDPKRIKFTGQRQVPVLTIGDEWRKDSTAIGIWLNDRFADRNILGYSDEAADKIMEIDRWVSDQLIAGRFRHAVEWENTWDSLRNGWKLSRAVSNATPLKAYVRFIWPIAVRKAGFIVDIVNGLDLQEPIADMRQRHCDEFIKYLGDGPFLGGEECISLADLSAYPTIVSGHLMGMHADSPLLKNETVIAWCRRIQEELPKNPLLVPDELIERPLL